MKKGILLSLFLLLIFSALTFAEDVSIVKMQGVVMSLDLKKNTVVINEMTFGWDQNTVCNNEKGSSVTVDKRKIKTWVYIEGEKDKVHKNHYRINCKQNKLNKIKLKMKLNSYNNIYRL